MSRNFPSPAHLDVVQNPLTFQPRKTSFYCFPLSIQLLPLRRLHFWPILGIQLFMGLVDVYYRSRSIELSGQKSPKRPSRVTGIRHQSIGIEQPRGKPALTEYISGSTRVVDIPRADISRYWQLAFTVYGQVELESEGKLSLAVRVLLHRPSRIGVSLWCLAAVAPCLQGRAIKRYALAKTREFCITAPHQYPRDIHGFRSWWHRIIRVNTCLEDS